MRRLAPFIAALLWVVLAVQAHAGGIAAALMPWTPHPAGLSTPVGIAPPTQACIDAHANGGTLTLHCGAPAQNDLLIAGCSGRVASIIAGTGYTLVTGSAVTFGGALTESYAMVEKFAGAGESATQTPSSNANACTLLDVGNLTDTVFLNHYTAGTRVTDNTAGVLTRSVSISVSGNALAFSDFHFCGSLTGSWVVSSLTGLSGTAAFSAAAPPGTCTTAGQSGGLINSGVTETGVITGSGSASASGSLINSSIIHN